MGNIHGKCWTVHLLKEEKNIFPRLFISLALASSTHIPAFRNQFALLKKKKVAWGPDDDVCVSWLE